MVVRGCGQINAMSRLRSTGVIPRILRYGHDGWQKTMMQTAEPSMTVDLEREIADLITQALNLDVPAATIDPEAPLYRDGLGLDSIDILEIALVISKRYGIEIKAESVENQQIFRSLRSLAAFIAAQRTK